MGLDVLVFLALGAIAGIASVTAVLRVLARASAPEPEREVLPSHYSSLLYMDPQYYPGHCTDCGTDNEPGYRFCEACGSEIPTSSDFSSGPDVRRIFNE